MIPGIAAAAVFAILCRYLASLYGHSGESVPPMFGDYEAQRHWMEITINLPASEWYFNTTRNDLLYWGLDYPPLTAYHSWILGQIFRVVEPAAVELRHSRGYESPSSKIFMRITSLVSDILFMFPSMFAFSKISRNSKEQLYSFMFLALQPALILIDHGHFQYNSVALGLALASFTLFAKNSSSSGWRDDLLGTVLFCMSLNFKHMGLFFAPACFFFLLGKALKKSAYDGSMFVGSLVVTVVVTFALCWLPFLAPDQLGQVVHRLFPLDRGLYEDKVANFWCTISPLFNFRNHIQVSTMAKISLVTTLVGLSPSSVALLRHPTSETFFWSLLSSSLAFFLFAFQVHEKSLLMPLMVCAMLGPRSPELMVWISFIGCFSMYPLLKKDGQTLPYCGIQLMCLAIGACLWKNPSMLLRNSAIASIVCAIILHIVAWLVPPPARFPDLFALSFSTFSFVHLFSLFLFANWKQFHCDKEKSS